MNIVPLQTLMLDKARRYDPAEHHRTLLAPFKEAILVWRVKFMSYEQIAATLTSHGVKVSPAAVGVFCRRNFNKPQILRERQRIEIMADNQPAPTAKPAPAPSPASVPGKRGPKIARDDY